MVDYKVGLRMRLAELEREREAISILLGEAGSSRGGRGRRKWTKQEKESLSRKQKEAWKKRKAAKA